jgi:hypothetical protein
MTNQSAFEIATTTEELLALTTPRERLLVMCVLVDLFMDELANYVDDDDAGYKDDDAGYQKNQGIYPDDIRAVLEAVRKLKPVYPVFESDIPILECLAKLEIVNAGWEQPYDEETGEAKGDKYFSCLGLAEPTICGLNLLLGLYKLVQLDRNRVTA